MNTKCATVLSGTHVRPHVNTRGPYTGSEEAELSAADLLELEAQNSKSSLYSTDLQVQSSSSSIVKKNGWFDFRSVRICRHVCLPVCALVCVCLHTCLHNLYLCSTSPPSSATCSLVRCDMPVPNAAWCVAWCIMPCCGVAVPVHLPLCAMRRVVI